MDVLYVGNVSISVATSQKNQTLTIDLIANGVNGIDLDRKSNKRQRLKGSLLINYYLGNVLVTQIIFAGWFLHNYEFQFPILTHMLP